jgi:replicative DNA helicase
MQSDLTDLDLERALLAAVLADNTGFDRLGKLEPDDLFDATHGAVLAAALDLRAERRPVNIVTLRGRFANVPFDAGRSVVDYLKACEFCGIITDIADVAGALKELSHRRAIKAAGEQIAGSVHDQAAGPAQLLTDAARTIDDLLAQCRPAGKTLWRMPEAADDVLRAAESGDQDARIPIGFEDLDRVTGGWRRGELAYLGGRPSMGKSTIAVAFARRAAMAGHGVIVFSLEMTCRQWMARMATDACWSRELSVPYANALRGILDERRMQVFRKGGESLKELPILIEERSGLKMADIASAVRNSAVAFQGQGKRLGLVIVDHLGKVVPSTNYRGQRVHEVGELSAGMHHLAKAENVAVLALHQLNRAVEGRDNKRPTLADLRDAGNLEQDADMVLFAYRAAYYLERMRGETQEEEDRRIERLAKEANDLELQIAKQRNGPVATIKLFCDMAANAVKDAWRGQGARSAA